MVRSDDETLLRRLLSAWRASRDPELEDAIDGVGALVGRARGGPPHGKGAALEEAWLALAASMDPGDVSRLLDTPWPKDIEGAQARIRALAVLAPDPRISYAAAGAAGQYRDAAARDVQRAFAALLARAPSQRILARLDVVESARREMTHMFYADLRAMIAAFESTPAEPSLLATARERLGDKTDLDALWAQHAASPGDMQLRTVLADRLQAIGDPRGELIALQLADDPASAKKAEKLLATHIDTWTGPLPGIVAASRRFERGFLVAAYVKLDAQRLERSLERPEWGTIEELALEGDEGDVVALVERMPLLTRLAAPAWAVERIAKAQACPELRVLASDADAAVPDRLAFPKVEIFVVDWNGTNAKAMLARAKELAEIDIRAGFVNVPVRELAAMLKSRGKLDLRLAFGSERKGLDVRGWNLRVAGDQAELALVGPRGKNLLPEIESALDDAGITVERKPRVDLLAP